MIKNLLLSIALLLSALFVNAQSMEFEPNNTILQNTALNTFTAPDSIGAFITASNNSDSVDFLKIILPYCGSWKFNLINPNGTSCNINMKLYNGQNLANQINNTNFNFTAGIPEPVILSCGGIIYVQIDQTSGTDLGAYTVEITADLNNDGWECNNNFSQATLLPTDTIVTTMLWGYDFNGEGDRDYFKVVAPQCGVLNITTSNIGGGGATNQDIQITVYQPDTLTQLHAPYGNCNSTLTGFSYMVQPGIVYVKIDDINASNSGSSCYQYQLSNTPFTLTFSFDTSDSCECNNTYASACQVPINSSHQIKLWGFNDNLSPSFPNGEDVDFYKVIAPQCGILHIKADNIGGGASTNQDIRITVFQPDTLTQMATPAQACDAATVEGYFLVQSGPVYVRIDDATASNSGSCYYGYQMSDIPFTLSFYFDTSDSCECNNTFSTACQIQQNSSHQIKLWGINGTMTILGEEDRDHFYLTIPQCSQLTVNASNIGGGAATTQDIQISVFQPDTLTQVAGSPVSNCNSATVTGTFNVLPGIAYIKIDDATAPNSGSCYYGYETSNTPFNLSVSVSNCVSIDEINSFSNFSISPNPTKNNLTIELSEQNNLKSSVSIINVLGEKLYQQNFSNQSKLTIDVSDFPSGIYFVQIANDKGKRGATKKFIKE